MGGRNMSECDKLLAELYLGAVFLEDSASDLSKALCSACSSVLK